MRQDSMQNMAGKVTNMSKNILMPCHGGGAYSVQASKIHPVEMLSSRRFGDFTSCKLYSMNSICTVDGIFVTFIRV